MGKEKKKIVLQWENNPDRKTFTATGAYGGPSPDREALIINFFIDRNSLPNYEEFEPDEHNQIRMDAGRKVSRGDFVREVQHTLVLTPNVALKIGNWLIKRSNEMLNPKGDN
jgi:hypothetical protein